MDSPGVMFYMGKVVLDQDHHEIRLFPGLPDVLSSAIEGWEVEYYKRQFLKLTYIDLIGEYSRGSVLTNYSAYKSVQPELHLILWTQNL